MRKVINYLSEVKIELARVVWPKRNEVVRLTVIVLTISALVGIFVGGLDFIFTKGLEGLIAR